MNLLPRPGALSTATIASMSLHDVAHQGEPQSAALGVMHQRIADAIELLKDFGLLLCRECRFRDRRPRG